MANGQIGDEREKEGVQRGGGGANEEEERVSCNLTFWFNITNGIFIDNDLMNRIISLITFYRQKIIMKQTISLINHYRRKFRR